jgi:hypothetical protein
MGVQEREGGSKLSREIKFRAWNSSVKQMLHFSNPVGIAESEDRYGMFLPSTEGKMFIGGTYKIMQYTGLKDNKRTPEYPEGQEIYEGDIVRIKGAYFKKTIAENFVIEYDESRAWFGVVDALHTVSLNTFNCEEDVEVIGDIYEDA